MSPGRVDSELRRYPTLRRHWDKVTTGGAGAAEEAKKSKKKKSTEPTDDAQKRLDETFLPSLVDEFCGELRDAAPLTPDRLHYLQRCVELWTDLLSQLPTRRFFRLVLLDRHVDVLCKASPLYAGAAAVTGLADKLSADACRLFKQLVTAMTHYLNFPVDDQTGDALARKDVEGQFYGRIQVIVRLFAWHCMGAEPMSPFSAVAATPGVQTVPGHAERLCAGECGKRGQTGCSARSLCGHER